MSFKQFSKAQDAPVKDIPDSKLKNEQTIERTSTQADTSADEIGPPTQKTK